MSGPARYWWRLFITKNLDPTDVFLDVVGIEIGTTSRVERMASTEVKKAAKTEVKKKWLKTDWWLVRPKGSTYCTPGQCAVWGMGYRIPWEPGYCYYWELTVNFQLGN
jgi:hypothetical protein